MSQFKLIIVLLFFICVCDAQVDLVLQSGHSAQLNDLTFNHDNKFLASAGKEGNVVIWDMKTGRQFASLKGHTSEITSICFHPKQSLVVSASSDSTVIIWDYINGEIVRKLDKFDTKVTSVKYNESGSLLYICSKNLYIIETDSYKTTNQFSEYFYLKVFPNSKGFVYLAKKGTDSFYGCKESDSYKVSTNFIGEKGAFAPKSNNDLSFYSLGQYSNELVLFEYENGVYLKRDIISENHHKYKITSIAATNELVAMCNKERIIYVYEAKKLKKKFQLAGHNSMPTNLAISNNNMWLASSDESGTIFLWDLKSGKLVKVLQAKLADVAEASLTNNQDKVIILYKCGDVKIWDIKANDIKSVKFNSGLIIDNVFQNYYASRIIKQNDSSITYNLFRITKVLTDEIRKVDCYIATLDLKTGDLALRINSTKKYRGIVSMNKKAEQLAASFQKSNELFYLNDFDKVFEPILPKNQIQSQFTSEKLHTHFDVFTNGVIELSSEKRSVKTKFALMGELDFIYYNDSSYYYASKGALLNVGFRYGSNLYDFNQFDIKYNRPDKIVDQLAFADSLTILSTKVAYSKRMSLLNNKKQVDYSKLPSLNIELPEELNSEKSVISYRVKSANQKNNLSALHVLINGVPSFTSKGISITSNKPLDTLINITVEYGSNYVQTFLTDLDGSNSFTENFTYNCLNTITKKSNLYLISIGSSIFEEKNFNLNFPAKDASDFESKFKGATIYKNVYSKKVVDAQVSKAVVGEMRTFLKDAGESDVVLVFYAGHGVLDKKLNYYLSTYDIDFSDPETKGLSIDSIENLLGELKCRKKLMFIDACHSGEIDKEDIAVNTKTTGTNDGEIKFRAVGDKNVSNKNTYGSKSSIEISKMLFADTRLNSGLNIISSAGAAEYAIEGSKWKNGVFTYSLLYGIKSNEADLNKDGEIWLSEMQEYLAKKVYQLTNGKQSPTSRKENLISNFRIW